MKKVDIELDILKHQPRDLHEETGLFEQIFCVLSLPVQIRPAAFAETPQLKLEAFHQTYSEALSSLMQKMSKRLCRVPVF